MNRITKLLAIGIVLIAASDTAWAQNCPPHSYFAGDVPNSDIINRNCNCDAGYRPQGLGCVKITTMRAPTKPECIDQAGRHLREDLAPCTSSLHLCLTDAAANEKVAMCLSAIALIKFDPTKVTVFGALFACGFASPDAYKVIGQCPEIKDACLAKALKTHKENVASCDSN